MVTVVIKPVQITEYKKKPNKNTFGFSMNCYFEEYLFKDWKQIFVSIQEASHYAEGFLLENFIAPGSVETIIEKQQIAPGKEGVKNILVNGLPYGVTYKAKGKHKVIE
jgi:hypothetical protein